MRTKVCGLTDLYNLSLFADFITVIFSETKINPGWVQEIKKIKKSQKILEIGAGHGRFTKLLGSTGASVTAVEPDKHFYQLLACNPELKGKKNISFKKAFFPNLPRKRYDLILLQQNVLLELLNQMSGEKVVRHLKNFLAPKGVIVFDYVYPFSPKKTKRPVILYRGDVTGIGYVTYSYIYLGKSSTAQHQFKIFFCVERHKKEIEKMNQEVRLRFLVPSWHEITNLVKKQDGIVTKKELRDFTFLPGKYLLAKLRFR